MKVILYFLAIAFFEKVNLEKHYFTSYIACFEQLYNYTVPENFPNVTAVIQLRKSKKTEYFVAEKACRFVYLCILMFVLHGKNNVGKNQLLLKNPRVIDFYPEYVSSLLTLFFFYRVHRSFDALIDTIKMDKDCGNTEMARDVIEIIINRRTAFCNFWNIQKEEFVYHCTKASLSPAQACKNDIMIRFQKAYFGQDDSIIDYVSNGRGEIENFLMTLTPFTLEMICW